MNSNVNISVIERDHHDSTFLLNEIIRQGPSAILEETVCCGDVTYITRETIFYVLAINKSGDY